MKTYFFPDKNLLFLEPAAYVTMSQTQKNTRAYCREKREKEIAKGGAIMFGNNSFLPILLLLCLCGGNCGCGCGSGCGCNPGYDTKCC
jgi:hypothetical protein